MSTVSDSSSITKKEPDFIRRALWALNLQAVVALVLMLALPYVMSFRIIDALVTDIYGITDNYAALILEEYLQAPSQETAKALALKHDAFLAYESDEGTWYTDGTTVTTLMPGAPRTYYAFLWARVELPDGGRFVVTFPRDFFNADTHIVLALSWLGAPIAFFLVIVLLLRRSLFPLRWMQRGIQEVTAGNLAYAAPVSGSNSRNLLARKFNAMTASMRNLIQSKDQLIMDLSHELRSPLTRIKVALALMQPDPNVAIVEKNVHNLEDILTTLLEAQRINLSSLEQKRESCRLSRLLRESVELRQLQEPTIALAAIDETLEVSGDPGLLKLLIHNLLDNALKYSRADSKPVTVGLQRSDNQAVLTIRDDGHGIPAELLQKVFEPFFKVAPERGFNSGYGLGLSLCRRIVELHGGSIELGNNVEGGVTATVKLPLRA